MSETKQQKIRKHQSLNLRGLNKLEKIGKDHSELISLMKLKKIFINNEEFNPIHTPEEVRNVKNKMKLNAAVRASQKLSQKDIEKAASEEQALKKEVRERFTSSKDMFEKKSRAGSANMSDGKPPIPADSEKSAIVREKIAAKVRKVSSAKDNSTPKKSSFVGSSSFSKPEEKNLTPEQQEKLSGAAKLKGKTDAKEVVKASKVKKPKKEEWDDLEPAVRSTFWTNYETSRGKYHHGFAIQGWRDSMEDVLDVGSSYDTKLPNLFGVYDGHGGDACSRFCKNYLLKRLALHGDLKENPKSALADTFISVDDSYNSSAADPLAGTTATVLYVCAIDVDAREKAASKTAKYGKQQASNPRYRQSQKLKDSIKHDSFAIAKKRSMGAANKFEFKFYCASVGDSRAVLIYKSGKVVPLSMDHNLKRKDELERIKTGMGDIRYDSEFNELLVYSTEAERGLNVTRTIGDKDFKPLVTAFPDVKEGFLSNEAAYFVIASDGLWGSVSNEETGRIILEYGIKQGCRNLADLANKRGCFDNCTILAVDAQDLIENLQQKFA